MKVQTVYTPWGEAQEIKVISKHITLYHTVKNRGYKISNLYQKFLPENFRVEGG